MTLGLEPTPKCLQPLRHATWWTQTIHYLFIDFLSHVIGWMLYLKCQFSLVCGSLSAFSSWLWVVAVGSRWFAQLFLWNTKEIDLLLWYLEEDLKKFIIARVHVIFWSDQLDCLRNKRKLLIFANILIEYPWILPDRTCYKKDNISLLTYIQNVL